MSDQAAATASTPPAAGGSKPLNIALIICSTRGSRIGPSVANWTISLLEPQLSKKNNKITLATIDLADWASALPLGSCESIIPAHINISSNPTTAEEENPYEDAMVNEWSRKIREFDGFIFVTPQYNWSFPAAVKVAIDCLFHEWVGKRAALISYGGRGGFKANAALKEVLKGCRMAVVEAKVELPLHGAMESAEKGILEEKLIEAWEQAGKGKEVIQLWEELTLVASE